MAAHASVAGNRRVLGSAVKITEKARVDVTAKLFEIEKYDQMNSEVFRRIALPSNLG
jgi:ribosome-associated translation inhibitor RaiA